MGGPPSWLHPSEPDDLRWPACEDVFMIETGPLRPEDRATWEVLARGYKTFYSESEPDEAYEQTWRRLAAGTEIHGLGPAWTGGWSASRTTSSTPRSGQVRPATCKTCSPTRRRAAAARPAP